MADAAMQLSRRWRRIRSGGLLLLMALPALAAEPPQKPAAGQPDSPSAASVAAKPGAHPAQSFLDLRLGDLRRFFSPAELRAPARDAGAEDIVVEGRRAPRPPDADRRPIPGGIIAPFWALSHPLSAWRVFLPDPNGAPAERPDPVPVRRTN